MKTEFRRSKAVSQLYRLLGVSLSGKPIDDVLYRRGD